MRDQVIIYLMAVVVLSLIPSASQALEPYSQHFEDLVESDPDALGDDGWFVYGNVYLPDSTYVYGYGPYPAPNHSLAFCQITLGEGGETQGEQVLTVFSDYENAHHANGNLIESNVYQEQLIEAEDINTVWRFVFEHKLGNIEGNSTAQVFIKTLDPNNGYITTNHLTVDMTSIPNMWGADSLTITIDESLLDQLLQIGFSNTAANYEGSGIFYDNLVFYVVGSADVLEDHEPAFATLSQNAPNPFDLSTRIEFALERPGFVELSVLDITGRQVVTLFHGERGAGRYQVNWDGLTSDGGSAPSGMYWYVLRSEAGEMAGRMILSK